MAAGQTAAVNDWKDVSAEGDWKDVPEGHQPKSWADKLGVTSPDTRTWLDLAEGVAAGGASTMFHGGDLIRRALGMERVINRPEVQQGMTAPPSLAGKVGKMGEQAAEFIGPGGIASGLSAGLKAPLLGRMALEAAAMGGTTAAQTGGAPLETAIGAVAGAAGPAIGAIPIVPALRTANTKVRQAVDWGLQRNPAMVDAATATGNPFIAGTQALLDRSPGGSLVATPAAARKAEAFAQTGEQLATQAHPQPQTPTSAASEVGQTLKTKMADLASNAESSYGNAWSIENDPANVRSVATRSAQINRETGEVIKPAVVEKIKIPVDMRPLKAAFKDQLESMGRWLSPADRNASAGYRALESIVEGPDFLAASEAEKGLGGLKELARTTGENPDLRDVNSAIGARSSQLLQESIDQAVLRARGGAEALPELQAGRQFHAEKMDLWQNVAKKLRDEPVQAFNQMTWDHDSGLQFLERVAQEAPQDMPKLGRAWIESTLKKATSAGDFRRTDSLWRDWDNLGDGTKKILFPNPGLRSELDNFFLLAKKGGEQVNPSGSALVGSLIAGGAYLLKNPISGLVLNIPAGAVASMLHSPAGIRALMNGLKIPLANKGAANAAAARILELAQQPGLTPEQPQLQQKARPPLSAFDQ